MRLPKIYREVEQKDVRSDFTASNNATGTFSGYLSTFGTVDLQNDRVLKGAFKQTIRDAQARRAQQGLDYLFPITFGHNLDALPAGGVISAVEDSKGLLVTGQLNMGTQAGVELYNTMKAGMIDRMSIGYKSIRASWSKENGQSIRNLEEIALIEAAVVNIPANPDARILSVKNQGGYAMSGKSFESSYQEEMLEDWQYSDFSSLTCALRDAIQETFTDGGDPLQNLETNVIPGLASALRQYVQEGVSLGYTGQDSSSDYSMMSAGAEYDEKAGRVLSAASRTALQRIAQGISGHVQDIRSMQQIARANSLAGYDMYSSASARPSLQSKAGFSDGQHGILDKATAGIMGHVRSLKSMAAVAARTNALRGWPIVRATSSDRSYFEEKEAEEETREMIGIMGASLEVQNSLRELRELREANVQENPLVSGVDAALARFLAATERK